MAAHAIRAAGLRGAIEIAVTALHQASITDMRRHCPPLNEYKSGQRALCS